MGFVANIEAPAFDIIPITPIRVASRKVRITVGGHRVLGANGNGLVGDVAFNITHGKDRDNRDKRRSALSRKLDRI